MGARGRAIISDSKLVPIWLDNPNAIDGPRFPQESLVTCGLIVDFAMYYPIAYPSIRGRAAAIARQMLLVERAGNNLIELAGLL